MHGESVRIGLFKAKAACVALAAMALSACVVVRSNCGDKDLPAEEAAAVEEFMALNGLEKDFHPNRLASQADVEGCPTGHIQQITASGVGIDTIPPSMASFSQLGLLLIAENKLRSLPRELTTLQPLRVSVDGNMLCDVDTAVAAWLTLRQPGWDTTQICL